MKITDVETIVLRLPEVKPVGDGAQNILVIRVHTDEGIVGIGEAHTNPFVLKAIFDSPMCHLTSFGLRELLVGEDPLRINLLWNKMYKHTATYGRRGVLMHAISGVDIALWDILGKVTGQPIHQLLGGALRDEVDVYASDLAPSTSEGAVTCARALVEVGYKALKFGWGSLGENVRDDVKWVRAVRRAVGPEVELMVDMGMPVPLDDAIWLSRALADEGVYFLEEPLSPDDLEGFARLVQASPIPIATGEKETTRFGFRDLMERGGVRIIQPDVGRVGGITEARRIATLAEVKGARVIPHCWSTDILVSATLHLIATLPDAPFLEYNVMAQPLRTDLLSNPIRPKDGVAKVPNGPGLGIELNEELIEELRVALE